MEKLARPPLLVYFHEMAGLPLPDFQKLSAHPSELGVEVKPRFETVVANLFHKCGYLKQSIEKPRQPPPHLFQNIQIPNANLSHAAAKTLVISTSLRFEQ